MIPILITLLILPTLIVAAPSKPSSAEIYIHEDVSVQVKQAPLCRILQSLTNAENSGKTTYGQDMRACFDPSGFNKAPNYQKWKATVGAFTGVPSGDDRPYLSKDADGLKGAKMNQPFVKGSTLSKISFGTIKGSGTFCSKTRYTGATKGRILDGDVNWLHGHHNGIAGIAHYDNGWIGTHPNGAIDPNDNWLVLCCSRYGANRYVNGVKQNDNKNRNGDTKNVFINAGPHSAEVSDWGGKCCRSSDLSVI
jgi:hypothetical protein